MPRSRAGRIFLGIVTGVALSVVAVAGRHAMELYPSDSAYVLDSGEVLGGDFLAFYTGGRLFDRQRDRLYDLEFQREYRQKLLPDGSGLENSELPFVYPPLVAAAMAPLSRLPFQRAFFLWSVLGLGISLASLLLLAHVADIGRALSLVLLPLFVLAYVPYTVDTIFGGQIAWLGVAAFALVASALLTGRDLLAGGLMSLSYYKPPLFLLAVLVLLLVRGRRFFAGFALGAAVLLALSLAFLGPEGLAAYASTVSRYTYGQELIQHVELPPSQGTGLVALLTTLSSSFRLSLALLTLPFLGVVYTCVRLMRSDRSEQGQFGLLLTLTASVAFSLQCIKYDLALLLVPMLIGVAWLQRSSLRPRLLVLAPFLGFYLEFAFRQLGPADQMFSLASVLFLFLAPLLMAYGWVMLLGREALLDGHFARLSGSS